jgi:hypothetical protein
MKNKQLEKRTPRPIGAVTGASPEFRHGEAAKLIPRHIHQKISFAFEALGLSSESSPFGGADLRC